MDTISWAKRVKTLPHRIFDHPMSGAYSAWLGMMHIALTSSSEGHVKTSAIGAASILGVGMLTGRTYMIRSDIERKCKQLLRQNGIEFTPFLKLCTREAFTRLQRDGGMAALTGLPKATLYMSRAQQDGLPWTNHTTIDLSDGRSVVDTLVLGSVFLSMKNPLLLTGRLSKKLQTFVIENKPEWLAEYPAFFSEVLVEKRISGLMAAALTVNGLHRTSQERQEALRAWLAQTSKLESKNDSVPPQSL